MAVAIFIIFILILALALIWIIEVPARVLDTSDFIIITIKSFFIFKSESLNLKGEKEAMSRCLTITVANTLFSTVYLYREEELVFFVEKRRNKQA